MQSIADLLMIFGWVQKIKNIAREIGNRLKRTIKKFWKKWEIIRIKLHSQVNIGNLLNINYNERLLVYK